MVRHCSILSTVGASTNPGALHIAEVVDLAERLGNRLLRRLALALRAFVDVTFGRFDTALTWARSISDHDAAYELSLRVLGQIAWARHDAPLAGDALAALCVDDDVIGLHVTLTAIDDLLHGRMVEALSGWRSLLDLPAFPPGLRVNVLLDVADTAVDLGDPASAHGVLTEVKTLVSGDPPYVRSRTALAEGRLTRAAGADADARRWARVALDAAHIEPLPIQLIEGVELYATVVEQPADTIRLAAAAATARDSLAYRWSWPNDREALDAALSRAADELGDMAVERELAAGRVLPLAQAATLPLRDDDLPTRTRGGWEALTGTERDVITLVAAGASNDDIAAQLVIGRANVRTHLNHIYTKLGLPNRAALAAAAAVTRTETPSSDGTTAVGDD
jgi:DNA-binding CsgD family transcriptional regulator